MSFICKNARLWKRIRLGWTIICHLRIEKEKIYPFWEHFNQTLNKYIPAEHKIRKNKSSEDFLLNAKQEFSHQSLKSFFGEYER